MGNLSASGADPLSDPPAFQSAPEPAFDPTFDMMEENGRRASPAGLGEAVGGLVAPAHEAGLQFVVGFSIGYVLLIFLRTTAFLAGLVLLALFGLQYLGVLYLNWQNIETSYQSVLSWVLPRAENFRDFITHNLSSSGMAAMGILTGLTRR